MTVASIIGMPIASFLLLLFFGSSMNKGIIRFIGVGGIVLSALATIVHALVMPLPTHHVLWQILPAGIITDAPVAFGLMMDSLALTMTLTVTIVSSLIALYSAEYMSHEDGFARFFAGINLFVAFMLLLILGDSLWVLFIGWEGVGLASYLLIGFFYREPKAVSAAMKAFLTTRVGDVFLVFAMIIAVIIFGTLDIATMNNLLSGSTGSSLLLTAMGLCLLGAATGKSAQLPLQTWLADAMWGPTPVSALIHAATMVTAGVYLLVRMSFVVAASPTTQMAIMAVGLATLIMAGLAALMQTDMKRVLAYSTMSQIGYMFLAVGALAFQAAMFHLVTHAFFKALLFLSAGIIGHALHSYDLKAMRGLRKAMPLVYGLFLVGSVSLMGLPLIGAGFFSKEWILNDVALVPDIGMMLFYGAVFGTFLTSLYTVRMLALAFFGEAKKPVHDHAGVAMYAPVVVLAVCSLFIGWLQTPHFLPSVHIFSDFLSTSVATTVSAGEGNHLLWLVPTFASFFGIAIALARYRRARVLKQQSESSLALFAKNGLGFDSLYRNVLLTPYQRLASALKPDYIKLFYTHFVDGLSDLFTEIAAMHTGRLSHALSFLLVSLVALASVMVLT